jgi:hypothetical protein
MGKWRQAPLILEFGRIWNSVVILKPLPAYPQWKGPGISLKKRLVGTTRRCVGLIKYLLPVTEIELWSLSRLLYRMGYTSPLARNTKPYSTTKAGPSGRAVLDVGLWPFASWDCGFEYRQEHLCLYLVSVVCCDGLITRPEESWLM